MPYLWAETFGGQRMSDRGSTNYCAQCEERAVKIEALQAENEKLRDALQAACLLAGPTASRAKDAREHVQWRKRNMPRDDPDNKWWEELADTLEALEDAR